MRGCEHSPRDDIARAKGLSKGTGEQIEVMQHIRAELETTEMRSSPCTTGLTFSRKSGRHQRSRRAGADPGLLRVSVIRSQRRSAQGARPSGVPKQAAEARPSSRGDARAAGRARTGGAKSPDQESLPRSAGRECTAFTPAIRGKSIV